MRSFISSFKQPKPTRAHIVLVLGLCALFCLSVEAVTAHFFGRISRVEKRRESEFRAALTLTSAKARHKLCVLVVGNSLLLDGVDFSRLQDDLGSNFELHRSVFENTSYLDWYYGLRRLLHAGARPDVVVLVLSPGQLTSDATDGDYSVQMLVDDRDLLHFARDTDADNNRISVIALDRASFFFGTRAEIRNWLLLKALPDLPVLTPYFRGEGGGSTPGGGPDTRLVSIARQRLQILHQLCDRYGVSLVLAIPPIRDDDSGDAKAIAAAVRVVPVLIPLPTLPKSAFADQLHLNQRGAAEFTPALAQHLRSLLLPAVPVMRASTTAHCAEGETVPVLTAANCPSRRRVPGQRLRPSK